MYRILVADDERKLCEAMQDYLSAKGFAVDVAANGEKAVEMVWSNPYDMVILDVMMPVMDGFSACKQIRKEFDMPILFLSALGEEENQLHGFVSGADDYIVKPFPLAVLEQKCESMIRRSHRADAQGHISVSGITLNIATRRVYLKDESVELSSRDFSVLEYFMENKGNTLTREQILCHVWGYDFDGDDRVVDTHVKRIRKALGSRAKCIRTIIGTGYCFEEVSDYEEE